MIVVEVVSPSSQSLDSGAKLIDYFRVLSVRHYVIVRTKDRTLIHHTRSEGGEILTRIVRDGRLDFGGGLILDEVFPG